MANDGARWRVTILHPNGHPLFTVLVESDSGEPTTRPATPQPAPVAAARSLPAGTAGAADGEAAITDPQKRYLFRLLAAQGMDGKKAEAHLKEYFGVRALRDIPKTSASRLIDQMVSDQKEAANGAA